MSKRFLLILVGIVLGLGLLFWFTSGDKAGAPTTSNTQPTNHVEGQGKTGVTLIEYGDYQCPVCYSYYPVLKEVANKFSQDIFFQFRNLPLTQIHQNAFASARAAEAADKQDKFWEMHGMLYENQDPQGQSGWVASKDPLSYFTQFAQQIGLNVDQFKQDYSSAEVNALINADLAEFNKTGQQLSTPSFFIDGKHVDNSQLVDSNGPSVDKFTEVINTAIKDKNNSQ